MMTIEATGPDTPPNKGSNAQDPGLECPGDDGSRPVRPRAIGVFELRARLSCQRALASARSMTLMWVRDRAAFQASAKSSSG